MASAKAILAAAKASGQSLRPGAAAATPPPQGQWLGAYSPTAINASPGMFGYDTGGYGPFLPRPPQVFTEGAFGPFSPILPVPVDSPPAGLQRPQPRRWQYPVGTDLPIGTPGSEGFKLAGFDQLKSLSRLYSILRTCIQIRKSEIRGLDWDIVLTPDAAKKYKGDKEAMRDFGERRAQALKWFRKPDPNYFSFSSFLDTMLDQVFTIDALSLYMCPTKGGRRSGKGLLGSGLDSLWLVDGASIRPLVGLHGEIPRPPAVSFQQYIYGVPRSDYTTMFDGRDLVDAGLADEDMRGEYRADQLLYLPYLVQADTPYGFSMVERCIIPIMTGLQKQAFQLSYFTEGTVPAVYISPGDASLTPNQIRELQDALNAIAGDPAWHHKIIVLPPGSKTMPQKDAAIVDQADEWIASEVAMTCDINPMEIGLLPRVATVQSPFAAREMAQAQRSIHQRVSTKPTLGYIQEIFNFLLQVVAGQDDMRFMFHGMEETQDQAAITDMGIKQIQSGAMSIDEFRDEVGRVPWGLPETSEPVVFTPAGPIPLTMATQMAGLPPSNGGSGPSSTLALPNPTQAATGAHAAAQGHVRATGGGAGANASGRPGSVTERQRSRGGRLAPTHAQGTGAPGRATGKPAPKAALAELQALGRHLRKGRTVTSWEPVHLEERVLAGVSESLAKGFSPEVATAMAAELIKATGGQAVPPKGQQPLSPQQITAAYGPQVAAAFAAAIAAAASLIAAWIAGTLAVTAGVLAGMILAELRKHLGAVLDALWRQAWDAAVAHAQEHAGSAADAEAVRHDLEAFLATRGANWVTLISGTGEHRLSQAIKDAVRSGDPQTLAARLEEILKVHLRVPMIAVTEVTRAWNAAMEKMARHLGLMVAWTVHSANPCPKCLEAQAAGPLPAGSIFPGTELAAPPAHPNCQCSLDLVIHRAAKALTRHVMDNGQAYWADDGDFAAGGGAMPPSAHGAEGLGAPVTYPALWPFPHRAAPQEPVQGGVVGSTAGGEPPHWDGSEPFPADRSQPAGDDGQWGLAAGTGSPPQVMWPGNYLDGYWPRGGHGDQQPPASTIPGGPGRGRAPNAVGKSADAAAKFLHDAPEAKTSTVYRLMRKNFPPEALEWVRKVRWVGPVEVPTELWDFSSEREWAAHHQQDRVKEFARKLKARKKVDPIIGTVKPGRNRIRCVDGHHRLLAAKQIGWPARAYIAFLPEAGNSPADRTYLLQEHSGSDPRNG